MSRRTTSPINTGSVQPPSQPEEVLRETGSGRRQKYFHCIGYYLFLVRQHEVHQL
jgi:hypothetical protein